MVKIESPYFTFLVKRTYILEVGSKVQLRSRGVVTSYKKTALTVTNTTLVLLTNQQTMVDNYLNGSQLQILQPGITDTNYKLPIQMTQVFSFVESLG